MFWFGIILGALLVGFVGSVFIKNSINMRKAEELDSISDAKIKAYCDQLRRTTDDEDLLDMSETELKDYLKSVMRDYHKETFDMKMLMVSLMSGGVLLGVLFGVIQDSWAQLLGISIGGIILGLLVKKYCVEPIKKKITDKTGIEIELLILER